MLARVPIMPARRSTNVAALTRGPIIAPYLLDADSLRSVPFPFDLGRLRAARNLLQTEIIVEMKILGVHHATIRRTAGRAAHEVADQAVLDAEYHVGVEIGVAGDEHMRHQLLDAGRGNHEMQMRRPPGVPALSLQHLADWTVMRDRIGGRLDGPEMEAAILVGVEPRAHREIANLVELLYVVVAVVVGVPNIDHGAGERPAVDGRDRTGDQHRVALHAAGDVLTYLLLRRGLNEEWPEHRGLGGAFRHRMVDRIDQHGDAERVGQQDEFLALVVAHVAGASEEVDAVFPFLLGRAHLAHEGMEVPHQRVADLFDARIGRALDPLEHRIRYRVLVEVSQMSLR